MSLLIKGVGKLSELEIDADKDWQGMGITNIKEVALAMEHGDMVVRTGSTPILIRLPTDYGVGYHFLHARSLGEGRFEPEWADIQDIVGYLSGALNKIVAPGVLLVPAPAISMTGVAMASPPGRTSQRTLSVPEPGIGVQSDIGPGGGVAAEETLSIPAPGISGGLATGNPVGGAIADDGGAQTDETAQANSGTANDMTLLPASPALGDAYYFGSSSLWNWLELKIGTAGAGTWTVTWEYWNGTAWASLADVNDGTSGFRVAGGNLVTFTRPGDWATTTVAGIANLYWVRGRVSDFTSITTQPLGDRAFIWIKH